MDSNLRLFTSEQASEAYGEYEKTLFPQMSDMFFWCVAVGYINSPNSVPPNIIKRGREIHWSAFEDDIQKPFLKMIAVEASNGFEILGKDSSTGSYENFRDILQSYADLGYSLLNTQFGGKFSVDKLLEILIDFTDNKEKIS